MVESQLPDTLLVPAMTKAFDSLLARLESIAKSHQKSNLRSIHQMGSLLNENKEQLQMFRQQRGAGRRDIDGLLEKSCQCDRGTLSKYKLFAELYSVSDVSDLVDCGLTWTHIRHLLSLATATERAMFAALVRDEGLTSKELADAIMQKRGNRRKGSGRRATPPANVKKGLAKLRTSLGSSQATMELLFGKTFHLPTAISNESPDEFPDEAPEEIQRTVETLRSHARALGRYAGELEESLAFVKQVVDIRPKSKKAVRTKAYQPESFKLSTPPCSVKEDA